MIGFRARRFAVPLALATLLVGCGPQVTSPAAESPTIPSEPVPSRSKRPTPSASAVTRLPLPRDKGMVFR